MSKIPATVITGFLGAGKTSLLRHLAEQAGGRRIAFLVNEFGTLGVDRDLLAGCGIPGCEEEDVIELANGCICCTVAEDFLPAMEKLLDRPNPPEHIVIETSGLALPKPLVQAFQWPGLRSRVTVDGVIAVVDAPAVADGRFAGDPEAVERARAADAALDHEDPLEELFEDQLLCADMIVLNKIDLADAAAQQAARTAMAPHLRPGVKVVAASFGTVDPAVLLGLGLAAEGDLESRRSHHDDPHADHDHDEFDSLIVLLGPVADPEALEARLRRTVAAHDILRVKGFVEVPGKPLRLVIQGVGSRIQRSFDRAWRPGESRRSELVVIGRRGLDGAAIAAALAGHGAG